MQDECLVCKAPLEYLEADVEMECSLCHRKEMSKSRCVNGHYVCSECHASGIEAIFPLCLAERSKDPLDILDRMMNLPFCHMHGPEHHVMVGAALLTACKNAGQDIDLPKALSEMLRRGRGVPGGACGFWGACGAGISTGIALSILTRATPLSTENFGLAHKMTAAALDAIGDIGGPRCCKRDSCLSLLSACEFLERHLGVALDRHEVICQFSAKNNQCIRARCPFFRG